MHLYACVIAGDLTFYAKTLAEAKTWARDAAPPDWDRANYRVELRDMPIDKANLCKLVNEVWSTDRADRGPLLKTWKLTPRNALTPVEA